MLRSNKRLRWHVNETRPDWYWQLHDNRLNWIKAKTERTSTSITGNGGSSETPALHGWHITCKWLAIYSSSKFCYSFTPEVCVCLRNFSARRLSNTSHNNRNIVKWGLVIGNCVECKCICQSGSVIIVVVAVVPPKVWAFLGWFVIRSFAFAAAKLHWLPNVNHSELSFCTCRDVWFI